MLDWSTIRFSDCAVCGELRDNMSDTHRRGVSTITTTPRERERVAPELCWVCVSRCERRSRSQHNDAFWQKEKAEVDPTLVGLQVGCPEYERRIDDWYDANPRPDWPGLTRVDVDEWIIWVMSVRPTWFRMVEIRESFKASA